MWESPYYYKTKCRVLIDSCYYTKHFIILARFHGCHWNGYLVLPGAMVRTIYENTCMVSPWFVRCYCNLRWITFHYDDVIMGAMASQITSLTIVYSTVYSSTDQSKHQSSASLAFVWGIHRWIPRIKGQWHGKCFHLMTSSWKPFSWVASWAFPLRLSSGERQGTLPRESNFGSVNGLAHDDYRKTSNISRTLVGNKIVDNSDVVGASPVGAAPTTSSFST